MVLVKIQLETIRLSCAQSSRPCKRQGMSAVLHKLPIWNEIMSLVTIRKKKNKKVKYTKIKK